MTATFLVLVTVISLFVMRKLTKRDDNIMRPFSPAYSITMMEKITPVLKLGTALLLSISLTVFSIYIILNGTFDDNARQFAYGTIGTVLGYWLKNESGV